MITVSQTAFVSLQTLLSMRNRSRGSHLGLLLLASQLFQVGLDNIPPVTLAVLALNVYLYLFPAAPLMKVMHNTTASRGLREGYIISTNVNTTIHLIRRPVWVSSRHIGSVTGDVLCYPHYIMQMTGIFISTWRLSSGKESDLSDGWVEPGSPTCCQSSPCSLD